MNGRRVHDPLLIALRTSAARRDSHVHVAWFDGEGNGRTSVVEGHWHTVRGCELGPAPDGHTHEITAERVPLPTSRRARLRLRPVLCRRAHG